MSPGTALRELPEPGGAWPILFIHVMKTGGTSFLQHANGRLAAHEIWPHPDAHTTPGHGIYQRADALKDLTEQQLRDIKFYAGHYPSVAADFVGARFTMTILRDPVSRTISMLHHAKRHHKGMADKSLDEVYADPWQYGYFLENYQIRQFAKTADDDMFHIGAVTIDDTSIARARDNLASVDLIGLVSDFDEFEAAAMAVCGWPHTSLPRMRVNTSDEQPSDELVERITRDMRVEIEFYEYARGLHAQRRDWVAQIARSGPDGADQA